eukprot:SAG11_NODE_19873_length_457_cov_0.991620_1_plen_67_part_10
MNDDTQQHALINTQAHSPRTHLHVSHHHNSPSPLHILHFVSAPLRGGIWGDPAKVMGDTNKVRKKIV